MCNSKVVLLWPAIAGASCIGQALYTFWLWFHLGIQFTLLLDTKIIRNTFSRKHMIPVSQYKFFEPTFQAREKLGVILTSRNTVTYLNHQERVSTRLSCHWRSIPPLLSFSESYRSGSLHEDYRFKLSQFGIFPNSFEQHLATLLFIKREKSIVLLAAWSPSYPGCEAKKSSWLKIAWSHGWGSRERQPATWSSSSIEGIVGLM